MGCGRNGPRPRQRGPISRKQPGAARHKAMTDNNHVGSHEIEVEISAESQKKSPPSAEDRRLLVEVNHPELSVRRQCELLGLNRSTFYYEPTGATPED